MAKRLEIILIKPAISDLLEIEKYLVEELGLSQELAERHTTSIKEFIKSFAYSNLEHRRTRYCRFGNFYSRTYNRAWVIFYSKTETTLNVVAVIHGKTLKDVVD